MKKTEEINKYCLFISYSMLTLNIEITFTEAHYTYFLINSCFQGPFMPELTQYIMRGQPEKVGAPFLIFLSLEYQSQGSGDQQKEVMRFWVQNASQGCLHLSFPLMKPILIAGNVIICHCWKNQWNSFSFWSLKNTEIFSKVRAHCGILKVNH